MEFDETQAVEFIKRSLPDDAAAKYDDDEILNVIDIIWDYYESKGMLEITDETSDDEAEPGDLVRHVKEMLKKDPLSPIDPEDVGAIVKGELDYEATLEY